MFGWHLVTSGDRQVILTTNEKDAMALFEATKELALALPQADKLDYQVLFMPFHLIMMQSFWLYMSQCRAVKICHEQK